ncbi:MAG: hypothetical protein ACI89Z_000192 [Porticoccus sp.]|jgi:hypothetical protein
MCVDKILEELGSFSDVVEESESIEKVRLPVLVAGIAVRDGVVPGSDEAERPLKMMIHTVENGGDVTKYIAFYRERTPVEFG